ncbi:MAG: hypothetical protein Q7J07_05280 [Pelolinea sp.]|nr:hypothetical protein [Pelolinea sp.]
MPAINWTFLCDYAFVDSAGRASIMRTFTFIRAPKIPFRYPQLFLALEYMADLSETFTLGAAITSPSGKQIAKVQLKRKAQSNDKGRVEKGFLPLGFYNCKFEEPGEYHVEIFINDRSVHFIPLMIHLKESRALPEKRSV